MTDLPQKADLILYNKQYNDAILDAYLKMDAPLFNVATKVVQNAERQLFDIVTGVDPGFKVDRDGASINSLGAAIGDLYTTKYSNVNAKRVINYLKDKNWATLITEYDKIRMVSDPTSIFVTAAISHLRQTQQEVIFEGITGTPKIYKAKSGAGEGFEEVAGEAVSEVTGKTIEECLKTAKTKFDANNVNEKDRFLICSAAVRDSLLDNDNVGSSLFAASLAVNSSNGSLKSILGFDIITYEKASPPGDTVYGYLVQKEAIRLGINKEKLVPKIDVLPHRNYATQIFIPFSLGASRINDNGVIKLVTSNTNIATK